MREVLEDLLERSLRDRVLLDFHFSLVLFDLSEEVTDGLVLSGHTNLVEVAALLQQLHLLEDMSESFDEIESIGLSVDELYESRQAHIAGMGVGLYNEVRANTSLSDLIED